MNTDVAVCGPGATLNEAAKLMWERDCGSIPIVEESGRVVGIVTDRDLCMAAYTRGQRLDEIPVVDVMSRSVTTCGPHESLFAVEELMKAKQIRRIPVVDRERLVGILSLNDIALAAEQGGGERGWPSGTEVADTLAGICRHRSVAEQSR